MLTAFHPGPTGLEPVQRHRTVRHERGEDAHRIRAAPDAGHDRVGQPPGQLEGLRACLVADHPLKVPDQHRERVRPHHRTDDVVGRLHVRHPVPHRLVDSVLQRARAGRHGHHVGSEHPHPRHVEGLPVRVLLAHVDDAVHAEEGACGRGRHAVLAGAGFGDHPRLAHPAGEQNLAERVVQLVRAGVRQVLPLEQQPGAASLLG